MANVFYPKLSSVLSLDSLPEQLNFVKGAFNELFDDIHFRDLRMAQDARGATSTYVLTLVLYKQLKFDVPGTGITIVLNPGLDQSNPVTEIPMSVVWGLSIFGVLGGFDISTFSFTPYALFDLILKSMGLPEDELLWAAAAVLVDDDDPVQKIIDDLDTNHSLVVPVPNSDDPKENIGSIVDYINANSSLSISEIVFEDYILDALSESTTLDKLESIFQWHFGPHVLDTVKRGLIPRIAASIHVGVGVDIPRDVLKPYANGAVVDGDEHRFQLIFDVGEFNFDTNRGIGYQKSTTVTCQPYQQAQIGNTGLIIGFTTARLDLSRTTNIPEADAEGRPKDFVGLFIAEASVTMPEFWQHDANGSTATIKGKNLLIGTGGFSGTIGMEANDGNDPAPIVKLKLGDGFAIELDSFAISFRQNVVTGSNVKGMMTIPGFTDAGGSPLKIAIDVNFTNDGFTLHASNTAGINVIKLPHVFSINVRELSLGTKGDDFFIGVSGTIKFDELPGVIGDFLPSEIEISKLIIWSNGNFEFQGGGLTLPKSVGLKVGPVELSVSALHMGSVEQSLGTKMRHYKYFGFDGGIKSGIGGVDAHGKGLKYYFTADDDDNDGRPHNAFMKIESLEVDIMLPGNVSEADAAVIMKGWLAVTNRDNQGPAAAESLTEYAGGISLKIPKLDIEGGAAMRITPSTGAYLVDADLELSSPIQIGTTGLGIYGFRGTIGNKYVLSKKAAHVAENATWWEAYRAPKLGINVDKFEQRDGFSFGAGITLATAADSGNTFSSRLFFLLSLPKVFLLEGQAAILSKRLGFDTPGDPPFYAAIIISDESIEAGFGVHMMVPSSGDWAGKILDLRANLEMAFYWRQASAWHLYVGQNEPHEKRVSALLFNIFNAYAYLMLSAKGITAGAGVEWHVEKSFGGIAKVGLGASLDVAGSLSFKPVQIGGLIALSGYAELKVFGIGFRLDVSATLGAQAPNPFIIYGEFSLKIKTPWPLPDINISASLSWNLNPNRDTTPVGFVEASYYGIGDSAARLAAYLTDGRQPVKALHMVTQEPFTLNFVNSGDPHISALPLKDDRGLGKWVGDFTDFTIPLDSFIDIDFSKGVRPDTASATMVLIGPMGAGENSEKIPPEPGKSAQVEHTYTVSNIRVQYWENNAWHDYEMWKANTPLLDDATRDAIRHGGTPTEQQLETLVHDNVKYGYWQMTDAAKYTKLRLLARTPLSQSVNMRPGNAGFPQVLILCPDDPLPMQCQNWTSINVGTSYGAGGTVTDRKLTYAITGTSGAVALFPNIYALSRSLALGAHDRIEIDLPKACTKLSLKLTTFGDKVTISYYRGYAYTPAATTSSQGVAPGPDGLLVGRWDAFPAEPATKTNETIWTKLRSFGAMTRLLCTGGEPVAGDVADITSLLDRFAYTDFYVRQYNGMDDPETLDPSVPHNFCWRLREVLRTLVTAYTGKDGIPEYLSEDVAHFYDELNGYVEDYRNARAGQTLPAPDANANKFYEKWMELLACLGALCDGQSPVPPAHVARLRQGIVDGRINELYQFVAAEIVTAGMQLNAWPGLTAPCDQLRYIAAVFAWLSVDFSLITGDLRDSLDPYFSGLEDAYITVRRAMTAARKPLCSQASCWRASDFTGYARLLCKVPPTLPLSTTLTAIQTLVTGAESDLATLAGYLNYTLPAAASTFCGKLRRALVVAIAGYSVIDTLPFDYRYPLVQFYENLAALVAQHIVDIRGHEAAPPDPDPLQAADDFATEWMGIVTCLCYLCTLDLSPTQNGQVASTLDAQLTTAYGAIVARAATEGLPVFGNTPTGGINDQLEAIMNFFLQSALACGSGIDTTVASLATDYTTLNTAFTATGALQDVLNANGMLYCGTAGMLTPCTEWLEITDAIQQITVRSIDVPASVLAALDTDDLLHPLTLLYNMIDGFNHPIPQYAERIDTIWWLNNQVRSWLLRHCLANDPIPSYEQTQFASVHDAVRTVLNAAIAILDDDGLNFLHGVGADGVGTDECERRMILVDIGQTLCATAPNTALGPIASIITLVNANTELFEALAGELDMPGLALPITTGNFCSVLSQAIAMVGMGYGRVWKMSLRALALMKAFYAELKTQAGNYFALTGATPPASACRTSCNNWLALLKCLCETARYRYDLNPAIESSLEALSPQVNALYTKVLGIAIARGMQIERRERAGDRCWMIRALNTYVTMKCLDYDAITNDLIPLFTSPANVPDLTGFKTAYTTLKGLIPAMCPVKQDGPYDPLRKREIRQRFDLLREIAYDNPDEPIDRVVIESSPSCDPNQPTNWQQTYWSDLAGYLNATLIPQLTQIYNDAVTLVNTEEAANTESAAAYDARDARDTAHAELVRAQTFVVTLPRPVDPALLPCGTYLHEICWLPPAAYRYNSKLPPPHETRAGAMSLDVSLKKLTQPIWRPNTTYAIQIETMENVSGGGVDHRYYTYGFHTAGPVGHFHKVGPEPSPYTRPEYQALEDASAEGAYPYASLRNYLDYQRSYPRPDGNVINAKPLYYEAPKLTLYYEQNYVQSMYGRWKQYNGLKYIYSDLEIVVKDPAKAAAESGIVLGTAWEKDPKPRLTKDVLMFNNVIKNVPVRGKNCVQFTPILDGDPPAPRTVNKLVALEPEKMYTAVFNALFGELTYDPADEPDNDPTIDPSVARREVHKYVFKTSRYPDFASHIGSYHLAGTGAQAKYAVYTMEVDGAVADFTAAAHIIAGQDDQVPSDLTRDYADRFNRLIAGALRLGGLDAADTTEFNAVKKADGTIIGLLVRSPEPINDPQMPDADLAPSVTVTSGLTSPAIIWSKDRTALFVSSGAAITVGASVSFRFEYREFNGDAYAQARRLMPGGGDAAIDPVTVTIVIP